MSSNNIYIRKAIQEDLDAVMQIIKSCTEDMISKKIYQWNDKYPNRETFFNDIENEDLLLHVEGNQLLIKWMTFTVQLIGLLQPKKIFMFID